MRMCKAVGVVTLSAACVLATIVGSSRTASAMEPQRAIAPSGPVPGVVLMCGGGGAIIGTIWGLADCISEANTKHDHDLQAARQRRNDCHDDAVLSFQRCLEARDWVPVSKR